MVEQASHAGMEAVTPPQPRLLPESPVQNGSDSAAPWHIELSIDEVTLYGFSAGDRYRIAFSLERELSRLLLEAVTGQAENESRPFVDRLTAAAPEREKADSGSFDLPPGSNPEMIGRRIARALYESLFDG